MTTDHFYKEYLDSELERRCENNPRYSARAFAKALDVDIASLSRILAGKQIPSFSICQSLFKKLEMTPEDQQRFLQSVANEQKQKNVKRVAPGFKKLISINEPHKEISTDIWHAIADWYHGAIMELTFTKGFQYDIKWMAKELGISELKVKPAVQRLIRLGLLEEKNGKLTKTHKNITSNNKNITSSAHKKLQRQVLEKAILSLENDPLEVRNMTSMTMAIDPAKITEAKKMIQNFSRELCAYLETGKQTQVYQLTTSLYPISKNGSLK